MKVSVSLPEEDVRFLEEYAKSRSGTRSAAMRQAVAALRHETLGESYQAAWEEWRAGDEAEFWDQASGDGL